MKYLFLPLAAAAALSGCAYYGDPYYGSYGAPGAYYGAPAAAPGAYYGSGYGYGYGAPNVSIGVVGGSYGRGYGGDRRGMRDRDHDGIPNRYDRDRDGDGVPNRADAHPSDPRRR